MPLNNLYHNENGNVFLVILLGVALFAALAYSVSRGVQSQGTTNLSDKEIRLAADDILNYSQQIQRGVDRVRRKGCSENDVSFFMPDVPELAAYEQVPESPDRCKVFHPDGGSIAFRLLPESYQVENNLPLIGSGPNAFEGYGQDDEPDLWLRILFSGTLTTNRTSRKICQAINDALNVTAVSAPPDANSFVPYAHGAWAGSNFIGTFPGTSGTTTVNATLSAYPQFCAGHDTLRVSFYKVLIER